MSKFFWADLEMSGLDVNRDKILEFAAIITDADFKPIETYHAIVFQPQEVLDGMDDWCTKTHGASGLTEAVASGRPLSEVDTEITALVNQHFAPDDRVILSGNSVGNDKAFIDAYMPKLAKRLHYRIVDVSSFKEVFLRKYGVKVKKGNSHRALDDIQESIDELKTYLSYVNTSNKP